MAESKCTPVLFSRACGTLYIVRVQRLAYSPCSLCLQFPDRDRIKVWATAAGMLRPLCCTLHKST